MRKKIIKSVLIVAGIVVSLILVELMLRMAHQVYSIKNSSASISMKKSKYRILCIGESTTASDYHNGSKDISYPAVLQRRLEQKYPGKYEVINGGIINTDTEFLAEKRLSFIKRYEPDMAIFMMGINDGGDTNRFGVSERSFYLNLKISKLYQMLWRRISAAWYEKNQEGEPDVNIRTDGNQYKQNDSLIQESARTLNFYSNKIRAAKSSKDLMDRYLSKTERQLALLLTDLVDLDNLLYAQEVITLILPEPIEWGNLRAREDILSALDEMKGLQATNDAQTMRKRAYLQIAVGDFEKAFILFSKSLEISPDHNSFLYMALLSFLKSCDRSGHYFLALAHHFRKGSSINEKKKKYEIAFKRISKLMNENYVYYQEHKAIQDLHKLLRFLCNDQRGIIVPLVKDVVDNKKQMKELESRQVYKEISEGNDIGASRLQNYLGNSKNKIPKEVNTVKYLVKLKVQDEDQLAKEFLTRFLEENNALSFNYGLLIKEALNNNTKVIVMQYPTLPLSSLKKILSAYENEITFVGNEMNFKNVNYDEVFYDSFGIIFGHCLEEGNKRIVDNLLPYIEKVDLN